VSINFMCDDALEIYKQATSRGLKTSEPFVGNKMWVVQLKDPDGFNIFFESATDVPEETMYTDWLKTGDK
jgi:lactoylglutathione lyase